MPQNISQYQYVSAIHHKVTGESMTQHMGALTLWQVDSCAFHCTLKGFSAWRE
ncbi:hypothetical protein [Klebsiella pneumoniae]|nr:hypothetical protein [Klebsiella pneumoniae]